MTAWKESQRQPARPNLRRARKSRGWSEADVAVKLYSLGVEDGLDEDELGVDARTVSGWELHSRRPKQHYVALLSRLFACPPEQLDLPPVVLPYIAPPPDRPSAGSDADGRDLPALLIPQPSSAPVHSSDVERRQFLEHALAALGGALMYDLERFSTTRRTLAQDRHVIQHLRQASIDLGRDSWTEPPRSILSLVQLQLAYQLPLVHASTGQSHTELLSVTCETATIAGRLAWMSDNRGDAAQHLRLATDLAHEAQDGLLRARVLAEQRNLWTTVHSGGLELQSDRALAAIDEAISAAGPHAPPILRVWLHNLRADEHAVHGHERECYSNLEEAERAFAQADRQTGFFQHWSAQRQERFRGGCAVLLGHWQDGVATLERVLSAMPRDLAGPYATTATDIAAAYAEQGETERATELLHSALDIVEAGDLIRGGLTYIRGVRHVHIHSDAPSVKNLDERLRAV